MCDLLKLTYVCWRAKEKYAPEIRRERFLVNNLIRALKNDYHLGILFNECYFSSRIAVVVSRINTNFHVFFLRSVSYKYFIAFYDRKFLIVCWVNTCLTTDHYIPSLWILNVMAKVMASHWLEADNSKITRKCWYFICVRIYCKITRLNKKGKIQIFKDSSLCIYYLFWNSILFGFVVARFKFNVFFGLFIYLFFFDESLKLIS